jgi:hypothetical protein
MTVTSALIPARSGCAGSVSSNRTSTGTRCTTFVKLPEALSGGRSAKREPEPAGDAFDMGVSVPCRRRCRFETRAACPACIAASWSSLKFATIQSVVVGLRHRVLREKLRGAIELEPGELLPRLSDRDVRAGLLDRRARRAFERDGLRHATMRDDEVRVRRLLRDDELRLGRMERRDGSGQIGLGCGELGDVIPIVDLDEHVTHGHPLVVFDEHPFDLPHHPRAHVRDVPLDLGVIGRFFPVRHRPARATCSDGERDEDGQEHLRTRSRRRLGRGGYRLRNGEWKSIVGNGGHGLGGPSSTHAIDG